MKLIQIEGSVEIKADRQTVTPACNRDATLFSTEENLRSFMRVGTRSRHHAWIDLRIYANGWRLDRTKFNLYEGSYAKMKAEK